MKGDAMKKLVIAASFFTFIPSTTHAQGIVYCGRSANVIQASGSFQSLISTVCWLVGFCFFVNGAIKVFRACRIPVDDPRHSPLWRRGILYLFLGMGSFSFPFIQSAMQGSISIAPYYGSGYVSPRIIQAHDDTQKIVSILCWFFCLALFLNADLALREALRLKGDPAAENFKRKAALSFVLAFALLAAPALYAFLSD
jgi:hypothetical protein